MCMRKKTFSVIVRIIYAKNIFLINVTNLSTKNGTDIHVFRNGTYIKKCLLFHGNVYGVNADNVVR